MSANSVAKGRWRVSFRQFRYHRFTPDAVRLRKTGSLLVGARSFAQFRLAAAQLRDYELSHWNRTVSRSHARTRERWYLSHFHTNSWNYYLLESFTKVLKTFHSVKSIVHQVITCTSRLPVGWKTTRQGSSLPFITHRTRTLAVSRSGNQNLQLKSIY